MGAGEVVVTGVGTVLPCGSRREEVLAALERGASEASQLSFPGLVSCEDVNGLECDLSEAPEHIAPRRLRRLGRLLTMAILAARKAEKEAGSPACRAQDISVFFGTGLGSHGDTACFLENMFRNEEMFPKPASFVHSVHNAPAAYVAMELGLKGENVTTTHRQVSFQAALWLALRSLQAGRSRRAFVGGADELDCYQIVAGREKAAWKPNASTLRPMDPRPSATKGTLPGEGASFCVLERSGSSGPLGGPGALSPDVGPTLRGGPRVGAVLTGRFRTSGRSYADPKRAADLVCSALDRSGVRPTDANGKTLLLVGANGDRRLDRVYARVVEAVASRRADVVAGSYKQFTGDFASAGASAFALASLALRSGTVPSGLACEKGAVGAPLAAVALYDLTRHGSHAACVLAR
ncbi:MAG: beta-ketoacyl synthase N-terminal-like domain-containing protein [Planctomycetota bacterium]